MANTGSEDAEQTKNDLENALSVNRQMQIQLITLREKIEKLLKNVKDVYDVNEETMRGLLKMRRRGVGMRGAYMKGGTFFLKGNMFFKDFDCRNCPDNPDYETRKARGEIFPMDLDLKARHVWSVNDKKGVVEGIKEQIIQHLRTFGNASDRKAAKEMNSEKLVKLLQMVNDDFQIDWDVISKHNVLYRHSPTSCEAMWNIYLHPSLKRTNWTKEENKKLKEVVEEHDRQNWAAIAKEIEGRSDFQCFVQYMNYVFGTSDKLKKFTKAEDKLLLELVEKNTLNGRTNWNNITMHFPKRSRTTLMCRYTMSLNTSLNREPFTPEEDLLLLAAVKEYGPKFASFPQSLFPNRTRPQLRLRYQNTLLHRHKHKPWNLEDDTKLMEFVAEHGEKSWKKCSDLLGTHSRVSCRTRYTVIKKFLARNPTATIANVPRMRGTRWSFVDAENWTKKLEELRENPNASLVTKKKYRYNPNSKRKSRKKLEEGPKIAKKRGRKKLSPEEKLRRQNLRANVHYHKKGKYERKKKPYVARLRSNALALYSNLKYGYDYKFGVDPITENCVKPKNLRFTAAALYMSAREGYTNFRFDERVPPSIRNKISRALKRRKDSNYNIPNGFSLPTTWSTAMAFRTLCIHTACTDLEGYNPPNFDENNMNIQVFRERLRILFYTTALLSRLHPDKLVDQQNIKTESNECEENINETKIEIDENESQNMNKHKADEELINEPKRPKVVKKSLVEEVLRINRAKQSNS
ncbi:proximal sequence element A Pbp95 isoform X1 [Haematobia irritans]|uniref:proximal sequence element A Pbp95 isoform X1 n=1 Tax=Haematobia irritans TaxID=7368 RepID=UPI003F4F51C6